MGARNGPAGGRQAAPRPDGGKMERIKYLADVSIRRACGFALMAIGTAAVGVSFDMVLVLKLAATCSSAMAGILLIKALEAPTRSYRRTEVWMMLDRKHDLPEAHAQRIFGSILRERYVWHATVTAMGAAVLWVGTFAAIIFRPAVIH
jgi:hypothetical protein